jgi:hypothetical protein
MKKVFLCFALVGIFASAAFSGDCVRLLTPVNGDQSIKPGGNVVFQWKNLSQGQGNFTLYVSNTKITRISAPAYGSCAYVTPLYMLTPTYTIPSQGRHYIAVYEWYVVYDNIPFPNLCSNPYSETWSFRVFM